MKTTASNRNFLTFSAMARSGVHANGVSARTISPLRFSRADHIPSPVKTRREGPVQYITLAKAEKGNSYDMTLMTALDRAIQQAERDPAVTTIVLESDLEKVFATGADLTLMKEGPALKAAIKRYDPLLSASAQQLIFDVIQSAKVNKLAQQGLILHQRLANCSKVTIAKVNGLAVGGGTETLLACDYILAGNDARFVLPEHKYGFFPDWGGTERVPQRIGPTMAKFFILEGGLMGKGGSGPATLNANEALMLGMVNMVVPSEYLDDTLQVFLSHNPPLQKRKKPQTREELEKLDADVLARLQYPNVPAHLQASQARLLDKYNRYKTASLDDLCRNELKDLYRPSLELSWRRMQTAPQFNWFSHQRDLLEMYTHFVHVAKETERKAEAVKS
jgi:enoyl-CoA hydratase/carnithine racemase